MMSKLALFSLGLSLAKSTWLRSQAKTVSCQFASGDVVLSFGNVSYLEMIVALAADRAGIRSVWIPMTPDEVVSNGYHVGHKTTTCSWGPWITEALKKFRGASVGKIIESGNVMSRYQEQLLAEAEGKTFHDLLGVARDVKIVSYFAIDNYESREAVETLSTLLVELDSEYVLVVRGLQTDRRDFDSGENAPLPGVLFRSPVMTDWGVVPDEFWLEHAFTLRDSEVVVFGTLTSGLYQAVVWGTPIIINGIDPEGSSSRPLGPAQAIEDDLAGLVSAGVDHAHSYDELKGVVRDVLVSPTAAKSMAEEIAQLWDYRDPEFVEIVIRAIREESLIDGRSQTLGKEHVES